MAHPAATTASYIQEQSELPGELGARPLCLVGLAGLDVAGKPGHRAIHDALGGSRRPGGDRAPLAFRLLDRPLPQMKPKRTSYEWYIPKGVLKRNWMAKHLAEVPAVVVMFYDLDWAEPTRSDKIADCSARLHALRATLEGRNTRLALVLVQQSAPLPLGLEDPQAAEGAALLCSSCELNAKSLFVLPLAKEHLQGYAARLETAFYELAQAYYYNEAKNVKAHRDHLNKTTHQYLLVRHEFKMGFLNELKQDVHTAHKHYKHAYSNLLEIRIVDTNALEVKTVAGFINYKLCRLMFALNLPRDAISQFKAHIDHFRMRVGFRELTFEHYAWLCKQHTIFADIFDEAVKLGLPAVQTQHPGFYYQQAERFAQQRKKACWEFCKDANIYPSPDPLEGWKSMEFYGQRPWRPGKLSADPPDPQKEHQGILALQFLEKQINHSNIIISLYGLAIAQFKQYKCPRMRRHLAVQMADEYFNSQDYGKALTLLTHMLTDYRVERWWSILTDVLMKALRCAYLSASYQDYVSLCLELVNGSTVLPVEEKKRIHDNLQAVLAKQVPAAEPGLDSDSASKLWQKLLQTPAQLALSIDMNCLLPGIECKARFAQEKYPGDQNVQVDVFVRNNTPFEITLLGLTASISRPDCTATPEEHPLAEACLAFPPAGQVRQFRLEFPSAPEDVDRELQIESARLQLSPQVSLVFGAAASTRPTANHVELLHLRHRRQDVHYEAVSGPTKCKVAPRRSRLDVRFVQAQPSLQGEWYRIEALLTNEEPYDLANVCLEVRQDEAAGEQTVDFSSKTDGTVDKRSPLRLTALASLPQGGEAAIAFCMRSYKVGERNLSVRISYDLLLKPTTAVACIREDALTVSVVKPFTVTVQYISELFDPVEKFYTGERFCVLPQIACTSPWPVYIEDTRLEMSPNVVLSKGNPMESSVKGITLQSDECASDFFSAETEKFSELPITVGQYTIVWKRAEGGVAVTSTAATLTGLPVEVTPLHLRVDLPAYGQQRSSMGVSYHLYNRSQQLIQIQVGMESSEAFMFSGYKQTEISILPLSTKVLRYNLYPLLRGNVPLPKLKLTVLEKSAELLLQSQLNELLNRAFPTHIFIMPHMRGSPVLGSAAEIKPTFVQ